MRNIDRTILRLTRAIPLAHEITDSVHVEPSDAVEADAVTGEDIADPASDRWERYPLEDIGSDREIPTYDAEDRPLVLSDREARLCARWAAYYVGRTPRPTVRDRSRLPGETRIGNVIRYRR